MAAAHYCEHCLTTFSDDPTRCPNLSCGHDRPDHGWDSVLNEGDLLDRHYRITRPLAVGGAGITYLAREVDGDGEPHPPDLAIKVLYAERDSGPFLRRLATEAQILQELAHDHIVECRGFVHRTGHAPYLVTLFESGGSLGEHVQRVGPLTPAVAAGILDQVLQALKVAHERSVVHRDLKPDNVLLATRTLASDVPWIRVADFGIAKVFGGVGGRLTRLGAFIGTPEYAAPEQFQGLAPTAATDVWAAGGLLCFLVTGKPPVALTHRGDLEQTYQEILDQVPPKLPEGLGEGAERLQAILDHTLVPEPGDRWTATQVITHLQAVKTASPPARPPPTEWVPVPQKKTEEEPVSPTLAPPDEPPPPASPALSWVGLAAILGVGVLLSAAALGVGAWAMGWFGGVPAPELGAPTVLPPVEVVGVHSEPTEPSKAERKALEAALRVSAADLKLLCHPKADVPLLVVVDPDGAIQSATADPRALARDPAAGCVQDAVARMTLPQVDHPVRLQVTLPF